MKLGANVNLGTLQDSMDGIIAHQTFIKEDKVEQLEQPFKEPTALPALFDQVNALLYTVDGSPGAQGGDGIRRMIKTQLAAHGSTRAAAPPASSALPAYGLSIQPPTASRPTSASQADVDSLQAKVQQLEAQIYNLTHHGVGATGGDPAAGASLGGIGGGGGGSAPTVAVQDLVNRVSRLETRSRAGVTFTVGLEVFKSE